MKSHPPFFRFAATIAAVIIYLQFVNAARAQSVPPLVNYQGRLANPDGSALPTADYQLAFKIYDAATNGALVWGPQIFDGTVAQGHAARIPVVQGYFNCMLGPVDTNGISLANAFNASNRFVEITITNHAPVAPRQQILTTPYAIRAATAAAVDDGAISLLKLAARATGTNVGVGGFAVSTVVSNFSTSSTVFIPVTNLSVTITTSGRPVYIGLRAIPMGFGNNPTSGLGFSLRGGSAFYCQLRDQSSELATSTFYFSGTSSVDIPPSAFAHIYFPPAGTYTYTLHVATDAGRTITVSGQMVAFEL